MAVGVCMAGVGTEWNTFANVRVILMKSKGFVPVRSNIQEITLYDGT